MKRESIFNIKFNFVTKIVLVSILFLFMLVPLVSAQSGCGISGGGLENPLKNICSFGDFVELLLKAVINIGLPVAVLFIIYSGFLFVTAQGNTEKLEKAKNTFFYTIIGVTIFLSSWALAIIVKNTINVLTN